MSTKCTYIHESAAKTWLDFMGLAFGTPSIESTRHAKLSLRTTLDEIQNSEQELQDELARHVHKIKALRKPGQPVERVDAVRLKPVLMQCRKVRLKLQTLEKKKIALENHMETLSNSELNQHVLQSMQKTSHALKGMGLDKTLDSVDRVMMDLEENHSDIASIQNSLSATFDTGEDCDWEAELALLLGETTFVSPPTMVNKIAQPTPAPVTNAGAEPAHAAAACSEENTQPATEKTQEPQEVAMTLD